ncbi:membrane protein YfhO [Cnuella takakiae]|uniref:Membrane protein YfhO n=1 Tax=Cnuella takakiae TaxID=1302690 RepID=A0A1M4VAW9_9BACT|nr:YfhO family protein [Cnuella takakiae]OLY92651.1 hypothetical protein BUE76_12700 [Cnuella takakiae]SHE66145.1 membrane protein YfhO [Cnuella takakiae]
MKKGIFQKVLPNLVAIIVLLLVAVIFCSPALSGKQISQSDVIHWKGMAQEALQYKEQHGHFPLWITNMFGGMPSYQIALESQNVVSTGFFHQIFTLGLPKPISFFFLASLMFYFLSQAFRMRPWIGVLTAIGYAYATYDPIIVAVGHDTKMLAIAYMPALLGALVVLYNRNYWLGGALTALFSALLIGMNHLQITYYFLLVAGFMTIYYAVEWIKAKDYKHLALALGIALVAGISGVLSNATNIFTTYDYSKATMRNGTLGLDTTANAGSKKSGLSIDYAFTYGSYGQAETMTMLVPGMYGGGSGGELDGDSRVAKNLTAKGVPEDQAAQFAASMPTYWGTQPGHAGPVYLGAIMCFLFVLGMVYLKTGHRWWMLAAIILAILMSWGKNFEAFNSFVFNFLPYYNKFRAPAMILVVPQLLFPLLGGMALTRFFSGEDKPEAQWKGFKNSLYVTGGLLALAVLAYLSFDFRGPNDESLLQYFAQSLGGEAAAQDLYASLKADRKGMFGGDLLRSLVLIALAAGVLWLYLKDRVKATVALGALIVLNLFDLAGVGKRYLNERNFVESDQYEQEFALTPADQQIKQDTGYYRVLNLTRDVFNDAITSYHHRAVGGYHPAKLSIVEDLLSFQLRKQPMNIAVLNMLNTKYVITPGQNNQPQVQANPEALGAAWFVKAVRFENNWLGVMKAMDQFNPGDTAILEASSKAQVQQPQTDSAASIQLVRHDNEEMIYQSNAAANGFAVFSEIFYDRGWKAYIDGREVPIIRTNYVLRGLNVPAGKHDIRFAFEPTAYKTGESVSLVVNILILLFLLFAAFKVYQRSKKEQSA